jgi:hypothetical protein
MDVAVLITSKFLHELVLETFLIMPLSVFEGLYRMPLETIIGSYKMPLYVDIGRRFEKMPQKTF